MEEQESVELLTDGYKKLNKRNKQYLMYLSQQLFYVQCPPVNPVFDKDIKESKQVKRAVN
ncbi:hypothetical protein AGMMS50268_33900 [Spirochaetia bacterium]|nr:hypothetical protein AGMMS50268_33900 [Spirochaetia bacterium]